jgi:hypothetical protein
MRLTKFDQLGFMYNLRLYKQVFRGWKMFHGRRRPPAIGRTNVDYRVDLKTTPIDPL